MKLVTILAASAVALAAMPAQAAVTFDLVDVKFIDGTSAKGSFTTDNDITEVTDFSIQTADGLLGAYSYTPDSAVASVDTGSIRFTSAFPVAAIFYQILEFSRSGLSNTGSTDLGLPSGEGVFIGFRFIESGQLRATLVDAGPGGPGSGGPGSGGPTPGAGAVPEPASWAMMIGGVGMAGGALRRRRAKVRSNVSFA